MVTQVLRVLRKLHTLSSDALIRADERLSSDEVVVDGFRLHIPRHIVSVEMRHRLRGGGIEHADRRLFPKHIQPGDFVVQLGGGIGLSALRIARILGSSGRLVVVEADPKVSELTKENLTRNGFDNVLVHSAAAVANPELKHAVFYRRNNFWSSGLESAVSRRGTPRDIVEVSVVYPPHLVPSNWVGRKVLHCDIEGYECDLLSNAEVLSSFDLIIVEVHVHPTPDDVSSPFAKMFNVIRDSGFVIRDVDGNDMFVFARTFE